MWSTLLHLLRIRRYCKTLTGITGPTFVRVRGTIESPNHHQSPVTELRSALFKFGLGQKYKVKHGTNQEYERVEVFGRALVRNDLVISCPEGRVHLMNDVPLDVNFVGKGEMSLAAFRGDFPPAVAHLALLHTLGELVYLEQMLSQGDEVELEAYVEPFDALEVPLEATGYRDSARANAWRVVTGKSGGRAKLTDKSLEGMTF